MTYKLQQMYELGIYFENLEEGRQVTVLHFCCVAIMQEYEQQWLTRQQEMLVIPYPIKFNQFCVSLLI